MNEENSEVDYEKTKQIILRRYGLKVYDDDPLVPLMLTELYRLEAEVIAAVDRGDSEAFASIKKLVSELKAINDQTETKTKDLKAELNGTVGQMHEIAKVMKETTESFDLGKAQNQIHAAMLKAIEEFYGTRKNEADATSAASHKAMSEARQAVLGAHQSIENILEGFTTSLKSILQNNVNALEEEASRRIDEKTVMQAASAVIAKNEVAQEMIKIAREKQTLEGRRIELIEMIIGKIKYMHNHSMDLHEAREVLKKELEPYENKIDAYFIKKREKLVAEIREKIKAEGEGEADSPYNGADGTDGIEQAKSEKNLDNDQKDEWLKYIFIYLLGILTSAAATILFSFFN